MQAQAVPAAGTYSFPCRTAPQVPPRGLHDLQEYAAAFRVGSATGARTAFARFPVVHRSCLMDFTTGGEWKARGENVRVGAQGPLNKPARGDDEGFVDMVPRWLGYPCCIPLGGLIAVAGRPDVTHRRGQRRPSASAAGS